MGQKDNINKLPHIEEAKKYFVRLFNQIIFSLTVVVRYCGGQFIGWLRSRWHADNIFLRNSGKSNMSVSVPVEDASDWHCVNA